MHHALLIRVRIISLLIWLIKCWSLHSSRPCFLSNRFIYCFPSGTLSLFSYSLLLLWTSQCRHCLLSYMPRQRYLCYLPTYLHIQLKYCHIISYKSHLNWPHWCKRPQVPRSYYYLFFIVTNRNKWINVRWHLSLVSNLTGQGFVANESKSFKPLFFMFILLTVAGWRSSGTCHMFTLSV